MEVGGLVFGGYANALVDGFNVSSLPINSKSEKPKGSPIREGTLHTPRERSDTQPKKGMQ